MVVTSACPTAVIYLPEQDTSIADHDEPVTYDDLADTLERETVPFNGALAEIDPRGDDPFRF
jgi:hypothetical protein